MLLFECASLPPKICFVAIKVLNISVILTLIIFSYILNALLLFEPTWFALKKEQPII